MNYDVWGPDSVSESTGAGPNAPLDDSCQPEAQERIGSATSAVQAWTSAGFPIEQIVLGVPSYGHSYAVSASDAFVNNATTNSQASAGSSSGSNVTSPLAAFPPFDADAEHVGDKWDGTGGTDVCGNVEGPGGVYDFWGLIDAGFLKKDGTVNTGIASRWDDCSQTVGAHCFAWRGANIIAGYTALRV
jgi:chitinase